MMLAFNARGQLHDEVIAGSSLRTQPSRTQRKARSAVASTG